MRALSAVLLGGMLALSPGAIGQETASADLQRLLVEWQSLQVQLSHTAEAIEKYQRSAATELAAAEAQKATLIEWLKEAKGEDKK